MIFTVDQVLADIIHNKRARIWLNATYIIDTPCGVKELGLKTYGLWAQIVRINGFEESIPECKTEKEFKVKFRELIARMVQS